MPVTIPKTADIATGIISGVESETSTTISSFPKSFLRVLSKALAGQVVILSKYIGFLHLQTHPKYAYYGNVTVGGVTYNPLLELGRLKGVPDPSPGSVGSIGLQFYTSGFGTTSIPPGLLLVNPVTQVTYKTTFSVSVTPTSAGTTLAAAQGSGNVGTVNKLNAGDNLILVAPNSYVQRSVKVTVVTLGNDAETEDSYRNRVLLAYRARQTGGAPIDYVQWAMSGGGVKSVYVYRTDPGRVYVYCEVPSTVEPDGIADAGTLTLAEQLIRLDASGVSARMPLGVNLTVLSISRTALNVNVTGVTGVSIADITSPLTLALDEYFRSLEPYIEGVTALPKRDRATLADVTTVVANVINGRAGSFNSVQLLLSATPVQSYLLGSGKKAKLGTLAVT